MDILDEDGRLFGVVNVVDVLVVVALLGVGIAGLSQVIGTPQSGVGSSSETNDQYAVLEFSVPADSPESVPSVNETMSTPREPYSLQVEETLPSFYPNGTVHVLIATSYEPRSGGEPLRAWDSVTVRTQGVQRSAGVVRASDRALSLDARWLRVTLRIPSSQRVEGVVSEGETVTVGGQPVARVGSITRSNRTDNGSATGLGLRIRVSGPHTTPRYGGGVVRVNQRLTVLTDDAVVSGTVTRIEGSGSESGS